MKGRCLFCQHQWSYLYIIAQNTQKTIEALAENYLAKESDVLFFPMQLKMKIYCKRSIDKKIYREYSR